jgi:hypothetical protein
VHFARVTGYVNHEGVGDLSQWLAVGGLTFIVATAQVHAFLLELPQWVTAIYLPCALLGLAGWSDPAGRRILWTVAAYLGLFFFVGKAVNQYWGLLVAPLLAIGAARAPSSMRDLVIRCAKTQCDG